jgi:vacuolar-type H+-ATPase subunit I/STV1
MAQADDITSWIALFTGLYALGAALGELRSPGSWAAMLDGLEKNEAVRFLTGIVVLALGAVIYLANPWRPDDWLAVIVTLMGAGMAIEGVVILGFGRPFLHFASRLLGKVDTVWALMSLVLGIVLVCLALLRF